MRNTDLFAYDTQNEFFFLTFKSFWASNLNHRTQKVFKILIISKNRIFGHGCSSFMYRISHSLLYRVNVS